MRLSVQGVMGLKFTMKRLLILLIIIVGLLFTTLFLTGKHVLNLVFGEACGNEVLYSIPSPDEERMAYVFKRDCAATTDFSYHLTVLKADEEFQNQSGNTFISEKTFTAKWTDDRHLEVDYSPHAKTHEMDRQVSGVRIDYVTSVE